MKVMDRIETVDYLKSKIHSERLAISRYGDGEYLLMNKIVGQKTEDKERISPLLLKSIKVKGQLVCIPFLKPHNIERKDIWYKTQKFFVETSQHKLYGNAGYPGVPEIIPSPIVIRVYILSCVRIGSSK